MALMLEIAGTAVGCGENEDGEEIAAEVAMGWVQDGIDTVSGVLVDLLLVAPDLGDAIGKIPAMAAERSL